MEDPVVPLERNLVRSSFGRTIMGKAIWENPIETWLGETSKLWMPLCASSKRIILICVWGWHEIGWKKKQNLDPMWKLLNKEVDLGEPTSFLDHGILGLHSMTMPNKHRYCGQLQNHVRIANFRGREQRNYHSLKIFVFLHGLVIWRVMQRSVWNDNVSWRIRRFNNSTKYLLHASMTTTSKKKKQNLLETWHKYAPKLFWNASIWHVLEDLIFYWSVNKLARSITKWTKACDKRQNRLISYIHHTCEYRQYCHVGNTAKQCRLGLFQDSDFSGRSWRFEIHFWRNIVHFRKSYFCSNKLDVQKTNCRFAQFNRIWNYFVGHWNEIGWFACS